ncbi:MAG TPA: hypothetical protein P5154_02220 [Candidatus Izemoplasmatales bacterium]|nr:hypothetical protein [Bacillota bacterium]HRY77562.1 hypothetical protein [Candidatus Izemoplasmatales bacterium]
MATYTKGFKKQSGDQILLKAIVGIIVVVLAIVGLVFLYQVITDKGDYKEFDHIAEYDEILIQQANSQQIQEYLVYFYNAADQDCLDVQKQVLNLAGKLENKGVRIFFVDLDAVKEGTTGDKDNFLVAIGKGTSFLNQSPMMISIANGQFHTAYTTGETIKGIMNDVLSGTYEPFN